MEREVLGKARILTKEESPSIYGSSDLGSLWPNTVPYDTCNQLYISCGNEPLKVTSTLQQTLLLLTQSPFVLSSDLHSRRKMKVIAAYLLAVLGGNKSPSAKDIKNILASVGSEADDDRIQQLLSEVKGKDLEELIASGREKLASVPSGGGGVAVAAAPGGGAAAAPAAAEAKKEEKVEEKEESDDDMGFSLFD
ncbi:hypothetical protein RIF29_20635 [Crotalaria pallida]|uniref:60S acidic ribosomal protein P2 n=1 Tax=Crotalaria pallida TaxID=3830 RepID=A0AAN9I7P6_CROPI